MSGTTHVRTVEGLILLRKPEGWVLCDRPPPEVKRPAWRCWVLPSVTFFRINGRWAGPTRPDPALTLAIAVKKFRIDLGLALSHMLDPLRGAS